MLLEICIVFQNFTFDHNLLSFNWYSRQTVDLRFKSFSAFFQIDLDIFEFPLAPLDVHCCCGQSFTDHCCVWIWHGWALFHHWGAPWGFVARVCIPWVWLQFIRNIMLDFLFDILNRLGLGHFYVLLLIFSNNYVYWCYLLLLLFKLCIISL